MFQHGTYRRHTFGRLCIGADAVGHAAAGLCHQAYILLRKAYAVCAQGMAVKDSQPVQIFYGRTSILFLQVRYFIIHLSHMKGKWHAVFMIHPMDFLKRTAAARCRSVGRNTALYPRVVPVTLNHPLPQHNGLPGRPCITGCFLHHGLSGNPPDSHLIHDLCHRILKIIHIHDRGDTA